MGKRNVNVVHILKTVPFQSLESLFLPFFRAPVRVEICPNDRDFDLLSIPLEILYLWDGNKFQPQIFIRPQSIFPLATKVSVILLVCQAILQQRAIITVSPEKSIILFHNLLIVTTSSHLLILKSKQVTSESVKHSPTATSVTFPWSHYSHTS